MATTLANISIKDNSSWNTYLNLIYPVGSLYFTNSSTSPASSLGGTWTEVRGALIAATDDNQHTVNAGSKGGSWQIKNTQIPDLGAIGICGGRNTNSGVSNNSVWASGDSKETVKVQHIDPWNGNHATNRTDGRDPSVYSVVSFGMQAGQNNFYPHHYSCHVWYRTA